LSQAFHDVAGSVLKNTLDKSNSHGSVQYCKLGQFWSSKSKWADVQIAFGMVLFYSKYTYAHFHFIINNMWIKKIIK